MRKRKAKNHLSSLLVGMILLMALSACGSANDDTDSKNDTNVESSSNKGDTTEVTTLRIALDVSGGTNQAFLDENDELQGYDAAVLRAIDEKLEDYEFELVATTFDDVFVGLQSGSYDGGAAGCFLTEERIEKYAIPEEALGASNIGVLTQKENADITSLADVATKVNEEGLSFYPMQAGNGITFVVETYNEENPDNQITIEYTSETTQPDSLGWISTGRYNYALALAAVWENNFVAEDGAYHEYVDNLAWVHVQIVGTYALFNPETIPDGFLDKFDEALAELKADGTVTAISNEYYGYDVFDEEYANLVE